MNAVASDPPLGLALDFATDGLAGCSARTLAARIRAGTLTSVALTEHVLARIAAHNPAVHAFEQVWAAAARRQARQADAAVRAGEALGPFHGVPTAVKSHHFVRGARFSLATRGLPPLWNRQDDQVVAALRRAGFVIVGKTTMSELGLLPITETLVNPPTRNPWDRTRTAGGSSGGAGAALAAGLVPVAPGSDGAGSVRIPAALNGLLGLKTTRGLVPLAHADRDRYGLTSVGPMGRSVDDVAAMLDVLVRPRDATHHAASQVAPGPLRIGLMVTPPFGTVHEAARAHTQAAADVLRAAGHTVVDVPTPDGTVASFAPLYQAFISRIPILFRGRMHPTVRWFWEAGRGVSPAEAMAIHHDFAARGLAAMDGLDVLLSPTVPGPPPKVGAYDGLEPAAHFEAAAALGMYTALANVTGQPALTVPFGTIEDLPFGVQLMGHRGRDGLLLALARTLLDG